MADQDRASHVQLNSSKGRHVTLYDAVAGRVGTQGFISTEPKLKRYTDGVKDSRTLISPEEALFKKDKAPVRYQETDFYFAHENLSKDQQLPDSDLLKSIHQYSSDFYARAFASKGKADYQSMNETALIAMGILLEEAMAESLGENGDMVLTEPEQYNETLPKDLAGQAQIRGSVPVIDSPQFLSEAESDDSDRDHIAKKVKS